MSDSKRVVTDGILTGTPVGTWKIDPMHTAVTFSVRHLMSKVRGRFDDVVGQIQLGQTTDSLSVEVTIAMASVDTGTPMRDDDLRSEHFFGATRFPSMRFISTDITEHTSGLFLVGDLTIRETTQKVPLEVEFLGVDGSGLQGEPRIGFSSRATVRRSDFGVGQKSVQGSKAVVGDVVSIELDVEAFLDTPAGPH